MSIFDDIGKAVGSIAPFIVNALPLPPPLGNIARSAISSVFGTKPDDPPEVIHDAIKNASPEQLINLKAKEDDVRLQMTKMGFDNIEKLNALAVQQASDVNATIQAEAKSEHWVTYSWRPAVGFSVAMSVALTSLTVVVAYVQAIFSHQTDGLQFIPGMLTSMATLLAIPLPILGIASWFRGKMQVAQSGGDTNNQTTQ